MLIYAYTLIILMFLNLNFLYINITVNLLNYSTKKCLRFTTEFLQHVNDLSFMQCYLILVR